MFGFELWEVAVLVGAVVGAILLVRLIYKEDDTIEDRRRHALAAAAECRRIHDDLLAEVLECYAIGDYSGIAQKIHAFIAILMKPNGIIEARANLVFAVLPELLKGDVYDARLRKLIATAISDHVFELKVAGEGDAGPVSDGSPAPAKAAAVA